MDDAIKSVHAASMLEKETMFFQIKSLEFSAVMSHVSLVEGEIQKNL